MKKKILIAAAALLIAGAGIWKWARGREFLYAGTIEATEVDLAPRVSSVVSGYRVKEGDSVRSGQILVTLDDREFRLAEEFAGRDFERAKKLFANGTLSKESYDQIEYKLRNAALKREWCTIPSPANGTVLQTDHEAGEWVAPGERLLTLADLSEVWAIVYVPQPILSRISLGMEAAGLVPESKRWFQGKITHINDEAEFTPKNVQTREERTRLIFGVKVAFPNPDGFLKPGMTIEVRLPH